MLIPHDQLESDTLTRLIEDFVTRDGTDNGDEIRAVFEDVRFNE